MYHVSLTESVQPYTPIHNLHVISQVLADGGQECHSLATKPSKLIKDRARTSPILMNKSCIHL